MITFLRISKVIDQKKVLERREPLLLTVQSSIGLVETRFIHVNFEYTHKSDHSDIVCCSSKGIEKVSSS